MKKSIFITALLFMQLIVSAQTFSYRELEAKSTLLADEITLAKSGFLHFDISANKKVMLVPFGNMNKIKYGVTVSKLDTGMNETASKPLFNGQAKLVPWLYRLFQFNNKSYLLYHDFEDDEHAGNLKLLTIDEETLEARDEKVMIDYSSKGITYDAKKILKERRSTFGFYLSENKKRLMLTAEPEYASGDNKVEYIWVYDENFKLVMEKKVDFKTADEKVNMYSTICDNSGTAYFAYQEYYDIGKRGKILNAEGKKLGSGDVEDDMKKLIILKPGNENPVTLNFKLEGKSVYNLGLVYSPQQNKVFMLGVFTEGWDDHLLGVFHAALDIKSRQLSPVAATGFSDKLVRMLADDGYGVMRGKAYGLYRHFLPEYLLRGDGTVDVLMNYIEEKTSSHVNSQGMISSSSTSFEGGDIIDAHLQSDSFNIVRVGRNMSSLSTNAYLFLTGFSKDGRLMLLYNDNQNNIERELNTNPKSGVVQKSEVCAVTIDDRGNVTRERLLKDVDGKTIGLTDRIFRLSNDSFLLILEHLNFMSMSTAKTKVFKITVK